MKALLSLLFVCLAATLLPARQTIGSNQIAAGTKQISHQSSQTNLPPAELKPLVGKEVNITGIFHLFGKFGPYISTPQYQIYILRKNPASSSAMAYQGLDEKQVSAVGKLRFKHYPVQPLPNQPSSAVAAARPVDHFYFEAEQTKILAVLTNTPKTINSPAPAALPHTTKP